MTENDEDYYIPLQDQRIFGAGIKRKRIAFIPASKNDTYLPSTKTESDIGNRYLSIVLGKKTPDAQIKDQSDEKKAGTIETDKTVCSVCGKIVSESSDRLTIDAHESSIAHQVCLDHSHPPSHLDREHVGVRYLSSYGWDPDSRQGLGVKQQGISIPIKAKPKNDTVGLREQIGEDDKKSREKVKHGKKEEIIRLNAKEVRKLDAENRKRAERFRKAFYEPDLEKYLGSQG